MTVLADMNAEFGWAPDVWRRLLVREFLAWYREAVRRRAERAKAQARAQADQDMRALRG